MALLNTQPNFHTPGVRTLHAFTPGDDFYDALIETHRGLGDDASRLLNARLVLLLANHIGDLRVLRETRPPSPSRTPACSRASNNRSMK